VRGALLPIAENDTRRPLLLVGSSGFGDERALDRSWTAMLARSPHRVTRRQVAEANHWVFTDFDPIAAQLQAAGLITAADRDSFVGAVRPAVAVNEVRSLLGGFLL
jgi:hypothetical protein